MKEVPEAELNLIKFGPHGHAQSAKRTLSYWGSSATGPIGAPIVDRYVLLVAKTWCKTCSYSSNPHPPAYWKTTTSYNMTVQRMRSSFHQTWGGCRTMQNHAVQMYVNHIVLGWKRSYKPCKWSQRGNKQDLMESCAGSKFRWITMDYVHVHWSNWIKRTTAHISTYSNHSHFSQA